MLKKFILGCVLLAAFTHCVQSNKAVKIHPNCPEIPATTFEKVGLDAKAGALQFGKLVTVGELTVRADPQIIFGISQSVRDDQVTSALICAAKERGELKTDEQIAYAWKVAKFFSRTNPTSAEAMEFYKQNPFPATPGKSQRLGISQHSEGPNSPNIIGNQNFVIIKPSTDTGNEIRDSEFSAIFTYERASLIPLGLACDMGYVPSSEKVAYFYLEGITKAHPEVFTVETHRPGMDLYGDIALGLVFDSLFQTFPVIWDVKISKDDFPFTGRRIRGYDENPPKSDFIPWSDLSVLFPKSFALKSPVQKPPFFTGKLAVPIGTKLSGKEQRDSSGGFSQTHIFLENDFVDLEIAIALRRGAVNIGVYSLVTTLPDDEIGVWSADYDISMKAQLKVNRSGHPHMPKYQAWVNNVFETVREQLDSKREWERTKEALTTSKTILWKPWKHCPRNALSPSQK